MHKTTKISNVFTKNIFKYYTSIGKERTEMHLPMDFQYPAKYSRVGNTLSSASHSWLPTYKVQLVKNRTIEMY